jgi:antibiotic biosynthesis monooxygenase (ABM) superfamily enzyme
LVTYIVSLKVRWEICDQYVDWLKSEHINEVLGLPGFVSADLCLRKGGSMEASSKDVQIIYKLKDEEALKVYMTEYAMKMREKGLEKFPGQFSAQREVWLETSNFTVK